ncbi:hypothetical protein ACJRO7_017079 [Eucalyptus globulus]|uniref:Probable purine permease n=1 Tax=Eucalyptus globulus TaxID=34317 RepID=A0ABD3L0A9_EUCGL
MNFWWGIRVALYSLFVLSGQSVGALLGMLYYKKGGNSKWLATLVPRLLFILIGLLYLPVSTYSLISSSQLAFNAFFSFFLNAQKFTPYITNSVVLLTISSTLLVFQSNSDDPKGVPTGKYALGCTCTIGASAGYGLLLSLDQLCFRRVIRKETLRAVLNMIVYPSLVAVIIVVGLLGSGKWEHLGREMDGYELGKVSYVMNLVGTAIAWQVFSIGTVVLIFDVLSLFSNSISVVGLPIVPIFVVVFFGERMDGIKVMAMILAIWGFISYVYQYYLDDAKLEAQRTSVGGDELRSVRSVSGDELSVRSAPNAPIARVDG